MDVKCSQPGAPKGDDASRPDHLRRSARFGRSRRLARKSEFDRVLGLRAHRIVCGPFVLVACGAAIDGSRLGMIVGKRQSPRAVDRNRIRRVVRESFRRRVAELPALDIVVQLARPLGEHDPAVAMEHAFKQLVERTSEVK
jgi:ribonuclease P protein component